MKSFLVVILCLALLGCAALAESASANPYQPVRPADMSAVGVEENEDGTVKVQTGSELTLLGADFGAGCSYIRFLAAAPVESRLVIQVRLDDPEGAVFASAVFSPVTKEARLPKAVEGIHDVYLTFSGEGTFTSWQAFTSVEDIEAAIRAERSEVYDDAVPNRYTVRCEESGTVEVFTYEAHDYSNDKAAYEKQALVYLPYGYDPSQTYNLLILCHGIGGNEYEWGLGNDGSRVKAIMDNLIHNGEIQPFIVVTPNGRGGRTTDHSSFYDFDQELRYDLLPALGEQYAVDIHDRDRCAMAGLSMGGMQTINLGMGKCLDLFSWFGAFSAAPTSDSAAVIAKKLNESEDLPIHMFYSICGTEDNVALGAAQGAVNNLAQLTDKLDESNFLVQLVPGGHDFTVWYLGFYNFARMFGAEQAQ